MANICEAGSNICEAGSNIKLGKMIFLSYSKPLYGQFFAELCMLSLMIEWRQKLFGQKNYCNVQEDRYKVEQFHA